MPYKISLERDTERGLDRYTITLGDDVDGPEAERLSDWIAAAAQNPTAAFTIDASDIDQRAARPVEAVLARLRRRSRVDVVRRALARRTVYASALPALPALLAAPL